MAVARGALSLAGSVEYAPAVTRLILERVLVQGAPVEYVHAARTAAVEAAGWINSSTVRGREIVGRLLQNAFFKAILPGFDPKRSPKTSQSPGSPERG